MIKINSETPIRIFLLVVFCLFSAVIIYITPNHNKITMLFYLCILLFSVVLATIYSQYRDNIVGKIALVLLIILLSFFFGWRDMSGIDDEHYKFYFENLNSRGLNVEFGYYWINKFFRFFTNDYHVVQCFFTSLTVIFFVLAFKKNIEYSSFSLAILVLFCFILFQILASALVRIIFALSIVFYNVDCLWKNKPLRYIIGVIIASAFHISALVMLILLPFAFTKREMKNNFNIYIAIYLLVSPVLIYLIAIFGPQWIERYQQYSTMSIKTTPGFFLYLFYLFIVLFYYKKIPSKYKKIYFICVIALYLVMVIKIVGVFGRLQSHFVPLAILCITLLYKQNTSEVFKLWFGGFVIIISLTYLYFNYLDVGLQTYAYVFPYKNIFFSI